MQTDISGACIGVSALAEKLGLSSRTVWRILQRNELPSLRIGRRRLVRVADVRNWLSGCEVPTLGANVSNISRQIAMR